MARYCCATEIPCGKCQGRNSDKGWACCKDCRDKADQEKLDNAERVDWDGEFPICVWGDDTYFFDEDDLVCWLDDNALTLDQVNLESCETKTFPTFDIHDFLCDEWSVIDHGDLPGDWEQAEKAVNDYLEKLGPQMFSGTGKIISKESLSKHLPMLPNLTTEGE